MAKKPSITDRLLGLFGIEAPEAISQRMVTAGLMGSSLFGYLSALYNNTQLRDTRYRDYDAMDAYSDIHVALDVYAEEATQESLDNNRRIWVTVTSEEDEDIQELLDEFLDTLDADHMAWGWARHLAKYGDMFVYPIIDGESGIVDTQYFHPLCIQHIGAPEDPSKVIGYKFLPVVPSYDTANEPMPMPAPPRNAGGRDTFDVWEFVHFKIPGSELPAIYGQSMIEAARQCWKQLEMLETCMAMYRLYRAGTRMVYYIDVGTASSDEAKSIVESWKRSLKTSQYLQVDQKPNQGVGFAEFLSKFNPLTLIEDIYWPVAEDNNSKVEMLSADVNVSGIEDVELFRTKLRAALGIPKAYFDQDFSGWNASRALAQQDIRFATKIERLQEALQNGIDMLCRMHLTMLGFEADQIEFDVHLENPSNLKELQRIEVLSQKKMIAEGFMSMVQSFGFDGAAWSEWILEHIMGYDKSFIRKFRMENTDPTISALPADPNAAELAPGPAAAMTSPGLDPTDQIRGLGPPTAVDRFGEAKLKRKKRTFRRTSLNESIISKMKSLRYKDE